MSGNAFDSLRRRAHELTARHNRSGAESVRPPAVAAQDPAMELIILDVAARLPPELKARLYAARTMAAAQDWIAAGAIYTSLKGDPYLARRFLDEVADNPREAGLALARAFASRMEPPPRDRAWHIRDRLGLAFQLAVGLAFLICRGVMFVLLSWYACGVVPTFDPSALLRGLAGGEVLLGELAHGPAAAIALGAGALWLCLEAGGAPRVMESARQFPARQRGFPPPLAWRACIFYWLWWGQALGFLIWVCVCYYGQLGGWLRTCEWATVPQAALVLVAVWLPAAVFGAWALGRPTLTLGPTEVADGRNHQ